MTTDPFERAVRQERARRHQRRHRAVQSGFRFHLAIYVAVHVLLVATWALTGAGFPWFIFPLLGWGIGLAAHAVAAYSGSRDDEDDLA
jgi:hypothetical protein